MSIPAPILHVTDGQKDWSPYNHTLTNYLTILGKHMDFQGPAVDSWINCGRAAVLNNLTELTIIAWVYTNNNNQAIQSIVSKDDAFSFFGFVLADTGKIRLQKLYSDTTLNAVTQNNVMPQDQWAMVACTYSESGDRSGKIYLNAVLQTLGTDQASVGVITDDSGDDLYISEQANNARDFDGKIAEVIMWNQSFDIAFIERHYESTYRWVS